VVNRAAGGKTRAEGGGGRHRDDACRAGPARRAVGAVIRALVDVGHGKLLAADSSGAGAPAGA
jgi:hypothetical protein